MSRAEHKVLSCKGPTGKQHSGENGAMVIKKRLLCKIVMVEIACFGISYRGNMV